MRIRGYLDLSSCPEISCSKVLPAPELLQHFTNESSMHMETDVAKMNAELDEVLEIASRKVDPDTRTRSAWPVGLHHQA